MGRSGWGGVGGERVGREEWEERVSEKEVDKEEKS